MRSQFYILQALLCGQTAATLAFNGCPADSAGEGQAGFSLDKFSGTWYEIYRDAQKQFLSFEDCVESTYTVENDHTLRRSQKYRRKVLRSYTTFQSEIDIGSDGNGVET